MTIDEIRPVLSKKVYNYVMQRDPSISFEKNLMAILGLSTSGTVENILRELKKKVEPML